MARSAVSLTSWVLIAAGFGSNLSFSLVVKLWRTFSYTVAKALQGVCNLRFLGAASICPSLILHGRTEIKARALVLGEVSALSFVCNNLTSYKPQRGTKSTRELANSCVLVPLCGKIRESN